MAPDDIAIREDGDPKLNPCRHIDDPQRGDLPKRVVAYRRESAGATVGAVRALRACIEFGARPAVGADAVQSARVLAQPRSGGQDDLIGGQSIAIRVASLERLAERQSIAMRVVIRAAIRAVIRAAIAHAHRRERGAAERVVANT